MSFMGLRHKGVEILYPEEWNAVVDGLDILYGYVSDLEARTVKKEDLTRLDSDIIPDQDNIRSLGDPERKWKEIQAHYGYFDDNVYVQGKRVLKDEDPIFLADIYEEAKWKITYAVDSSKATTTLDLLREYTESIREEVKAIRSRTESIEQHVITIESYTESIERETREIRKTTTVIEQRVATIESYTQRIEDHLSYFREKAMTEQGVKVVITEPKVMDVDTLRTESTETGEINTAVETPPKTLLTPPSGKRISTRGVYIFSDSTAGEIEVRFGISNKLVAKIYCSRYYNVTLPEIHLLGLPDEPLIMYWQDLSINAKIFWVIRYKIEE